MTPFSPLHLLVLIFLITLLITFFQLGILTLAFEKLGLSANSAISLLLLSLIGSLINLPLFTIKIPPGQVFVTPKLYHGLLRRSMRPFVDKTVVAINVGGALIPLFLSAYLIYHSSLGLPTIILATVGVSAVCYFVSRPIPGVGIGMPIFIAPITAAVVALLLGDNQSAPLAYICGTLGVLIGADLLRLRDIQSLGTAIASIGGAGTFDGIFLTGIVAVLLA